MMPSIWRSFMIFAVMSHTSRPFHCHAISIGAAMTSRAQ